MTYADRNAVAGLRDGRAGALVIALGPASIMVTP